uniref:Uncharacterized protein n=1 Tax=Lactuca sativa TaxID=4236 RepID=A0A9R1XPN7_LACSA|nr:hypothetical protein LSAT_V11C200060560 [Lactuca sativa]
MSGFVKYIFQAAVSGLQNQPIINVVLNVSISNITDDGCDKSTYTELKSLKVLNLGFNDMSDAVLSHLKGLINLESLNLDSCRIGDKGLVHLAGLVNLQSLNLSFTLITDGGLRHLAVKRIFALISQHL